MAELWGIYDDMSYVLSKEEEIELILKKLDFHTSPLASNWFAACEKAGGAGWDVYGHWKKGCLPIQKYKNYDAYPEGIGNDKHGYNQWTRDLVKWVLFIHQYDSAYRPELVPEKPVRELIRITGLPEPFVRGYLAYEGRGAAELVRSEAKRKAILAEYGIKDDRKCGKKYRIHDNLESISRYGFNPPSIKTLVWAVMTTAEAYKK